MINQKTPKPTITAAIEAISSSLTFCRNSGDLMSGVVDELVGALVCGVGVLMIFTRWNRSASHRVSIMKAMAMKSLYIGCFIEWLKYGGHNCVRHTALSE